MVAPAVEGIDLFKIAGRSISGWIPSLKMGAASHVRQPFCSQLEERLLRWLEYNPRWSATLVATSGLRLQRRTDYLPRNMRHSRLATRLKTNPMTICPMWWAL